jgi:hypothetical protein
LYFLNHDLGKGVKKAFDLKQVTGRIFPEKRSLICLGGKNEK